MAVYQGKTVKLNKPRRISKGETSYGKKKSVVYVKDGSKTKRVTFGDPNMTIKKTNLRIEKVLGLDIIVKTLALKQKLDIGLVKHGSNTR